MSAMRVKLDEIFIAWHMKLYNFVLQSNEITLMPGKNFLYFWWIDTMGN